MSNAVDIEHILESLTEELAALPETVAVLVHGSYVKGNFRPGSDLDVICMTKADWFSMEIRHIEGIPVEIHHTPVQQVFQELKKYSPTNDNFQLLTLTEGRVLLERGGALAKLRSEAEELLKNGPTPPNPLEIYIGRAFLKKRLMELRRLIANAPAEGVDGMVRILADSLFQRCLGAYCRTHQLWGAKFTELVKNLMESSPDMATSCQQFLDAQTHQDLLNSLEQIVELTIAPIGWGPDSAKTGPVPLQFANINRGGGTDG